MEDLLEVGVLDPAKVTRSGLMNACGIAGIMLTTQVRLLQRLPMVNGRSQPAQPPAQQADRSCMSVTALALLRHRDWTTWHLKTRTQRCIPVTHVPSTPRCMCFPEIVVREIEGACAVLLQAIMVERKEDKPAAAAGGGGVPGGYGPGGMPAGLTM